MQTPSNESSAHNATVFQYLLKPVIAYIEQQERTRTPHHNETLTYLDFFRLLAYYVVSDISSIALFLKTYLRKGLIPEEIGLRPVPRSTFNDAFERFSPDVFRAVFVFLLGSLSLRQIPELTSLGTLCCVDGSLFPTLCSMQWAEYKTTCQAVKLHLCFELNRMIPIDIVVGTGNSNERNALRQMLQAGTTSIADRGYVSFQLFHDVLHARAHLIFRMKANVQYQIHTTSAVMVPDAVRSLLHDITDNMIQCSNDPHQHHYRLVTFRIGTTPFLLLTDREDLTTFQIIVLYAYRWQIELLFRFLKRSMQGIHLINHSEEGVTIQFYMYLIVALLQLRLKQEVMLAQEQPEQPEQPEPTEPPEPSPTSKNIFHDIPPETDVSHPYGFFRMIGAKLQMYWKIGIHWLTTLRNILHHPFDERAIELLGMT